MALPNWTARVFRTPTCPPSAILSIRPARRLGTKPTNPRGALIVEAVIALVLLTTATVALTKLARSAAALDRQSDQRLTATLAAENTIQRLRGVATEKLSDEAEQVADLVAQDAGCEIDVSTEPFTTGNRAGVHVRVEARISPTIRIRLHDWRFAPEPTDTQPSDSDRTRETEVTILQRFTTIDLLSLGRVERQRGEGELNLKLAVLNTVESTNTLMALPARPSRPSRRKVEVRCVDTNAQEEGEDKLTLPNGGDDD